MYSKKPQVKKKRQGAADRQRLQSEKWPIHECMINPSWKTSDLATILISRRQPNGNLTFGVYLVDILCLGLKNTYCNIDFTPARYETEVRPRLTPNEVPVDCPVSLAHGIIYGAIDYARRFGFPPQADFKLSQYVLEPREEVEPCEPIVFGKDGKPCHIPGPDNDSDRISWTSTTR